MTYSTFTQCEQKLFKVFDFFVVPKNTAHKRNNKSCMVAAVVTLVCAVKPLASVYCTQSLTYLVHSNCVRSLQSRARSCISLAPVSQLLREKKETACSLSLAVFVHLQFWAFIAPFSLSVRIETTLNRLRFVTSNWRAMGQPLTLR